MWGISKIFICIERKSNFLEKNCKKVTIVFKIKLKIKKKTEEENNNVRKKIETNIQKVN